jgi:hypothetical protein
MENTYAFFIKKQMYLIIFHKVENEDTGMDLSTIEILR